MDLFQGYRTVSICQSELTVPRLLWFAIVVPFISQM